MTRGSQRAAPSARLGLWFPMMWMLGASLLLALQPAFAEDGYDLWLRYRPLATEQRAIYAPATAQLVMPAPSPTLVAAREELVRGLTGLMSQSPAAAERVSSAGALLVGTPQSQGQIAQLDLGLKGLPAQGYVIRQRRVRPDLVAAGDPCGG